MPTQFLNSPLRRLLFPYLEGADSEDPLRPSHWMSNITAEALGLEPSSTPSSTPSAASTRPGPRTRFPPSSKYHSFSSSALSCEDREEMRSVPWASMYFNQCNQVPATSSDDDDDEANSCATGAGVPPSMSNVAGDRPHRRSTQPHRLSHHHQAPVRTHSSPAPTTAPSPIVKLAEGQAAPAIRRRARGASAPLPLTPAQPLGHVNTSLPVQIPPPRICLRGPADSPVQAVGQAVDHRRGRNSWVGRQRVGEISSSASCSNLVLSGESDGSYHGDAGDDDPESQLAVGIARLKTERRKEEAASLAYPQFQEYQQQKEKEAEVENVITLTTEDVSDEDTDGSSDSASLLIAVNSGFISSLGDLLLEWKIRRDGPFEKRAASSLSVHSLAAKNLHVSDRANLPRSHSLDALVETEFCRRLGGRPQLGLESVSTPASLKNEVKKWSQGRRRRGSASQRNSPLSSSRSSSPPPSERPSPETAPSTSFFGAFPFVHALLIRSAAYRHFSSIAEGLADEEDDEELHAPLPLVRGSAEDRFSVSAEAEEGENDDDSYDEDNAEPNSTAYSSLWATPAPSRSNSSYNLNFLGDERSAFQQDDYYTPPPSTAATSAIPRVVRKQRYRSASGLKRLSESVSQTSQTKMPGVSPLWDVMYVSEDHEGAVKDLESGEGNQLPYQRSWTSLLGVSV